jgi:hypothetical protein
MTAAQTRPSPGTAAGYATDEIVVATQHLPFVMSTLGRGVATARDESARLGLSRVEITDSKAALELFADVLADRSRVAAAAGRPTADQSDLDKIIAGLRLTAAKAWDRWMPTLGKNRIVLGGEGTPYTVLKGADLPERARRPEPVAAGGTEGRNVTVGLLDTPVERHVDLDGALDVEGSTLLDRSDSYSFREGHSTFLAGLVHRAAPGALIRVCGVLDGREATASAWDVALGLLALVDSGVHVVVMSLGCFTEDGRPPLVLQTAVTLVRDRAVLVAAAGNHGANDDADDVSPIAPMWPAALDGVLAIGSSGTRRAPSDFTPRTPWVDYLARGERLTSTFLRGKVSLGEQPPQEFDGYARWGGTSMSAASAGGYISTRFRFGDEPRDVVSRILTETPGDVLSPASE